MSLNDTIAKVRDAILVRPAALSTDDAAWLQADARRRAADDKSSTMDAEEVYRLFGVTDYDELTNAFYLGFPRGERKVMAGRGPGQDTVRVRWVRYDVDFWFERFRPVAEGVFRRKKGG